MQTQEAYRQTVTTEALARNPLRFARLMNVYNAMPWGKTPNYAKTMQAPQGYLSLFDTEPAGDKLQVPEEGDYHLYDAKTGEMTKERMSKKKTSFPDMYKGQVSATSNKENQA